MQVAFPKFNNSYKYSSKNISFGISYDFNFQKEDSFVYSDKKNEEFEKLLKDKRIKKLYKKEILNVYNLSQILKFNEDENKKANILLEIENFYKLLQKELISGQLLIEFSKLNDESFEKLFKMLQSKGVYKYLKTDDKSHCFSALFTSDKTDKNKAIDFLYTNFKDGCFINFNLLQQDLGVEVTAEKFPEDTETPFIVKTFLNNEEKISYYTSLDEIKVEKYADSDKLIAIKHSQSISGMRDIEEQYEIIYDGKTPKKVIYTKLSDIYPYSYSVKEYNVDDEKLEDLIYKIKKGKIKEDKILADVQKRKDGSFVLKEEYNQNGYKIKRFFNEKRDENDDISGFLYKYQIFDLKRKLMDIRRTFVKNADGSTTTTVNGKKYKSYFDNRQMKIIIVDDEDKTTVLDLKDKFSLNFLNRKKLWEFLKLIPADIQIMTEKYVNKIKISKDAAFFEKKRKLVKTTTTLSDFSHEIGHSISLYEHFSCDEELKRIYKEEFQEFKKEYPSIAQDVVFYFSPDGKKDNNGLEEFIAETYMLFSNFHNEGVDLGRAMYIVRYFPKTVLKIYEMFEENDDIIKQ